MKILITENQFERLVKNIIKEQNNIPTKLSEKTNDWLISWQGPSEVWDVVFPEPDIIKELSRFKSNIPLKLYRTIDRKFLKYENERELRSFSKDKNVFVNLIGYENITQIVKPENILVDFDNLEQNSDWDDEGLKEVIVTKRNLKTFNPTKEFYEKEQLRSQSVRPSREKMIKFLLDAGWDEKTYTGYSINPKEKYTKLSDLPDSVLLHHYRTEKDIQ